MYMYIYMCIHMHTYIYISICIRIEHEDFEPDEDRELLEEEQEDDHDDHPEWAKRQEARMMMNYSWPVATGVAFKHHTHATSIRIVADDMADTSHMSHATGE